MNPVQQKINAAFHPFLVTIRDLATPISSILFIFGLYLVMVGKPKSGLDKIKWAVVGYTAIESWPWIQTLISAITHAG